MFGTVSRTIDDVARTGVYPRSAPRPTESRAEHRLYEALKKGLPKGWAAFHSLRLRTDDGYEGEGDFVLAVPERGVVILEVKGGTIECRDGHWFQNGKRLERAPRDQGFRFSQLLRARLDEDLDYVPLCAPAVAFPDMQFDEGPPHADLRGLVLGADDLPFLGEALPAIADRLLRGQSARGQDWIERLHEYWGETWTPRLTLRHEKEQREADMMPFDAAQLYVLSALQHNPRMLVTGTPGSGKTLLARELHRRYTARGLRPLYLCWTRALATGLRADGLRDAWAIREYAAHLLESSNTRLQDGAPPSLWTSETWDAAPFEAACECAPNLSPPWDAVIVDEAQDLTEHDWELVKALAGDRVLWAFGDDGQAYWPERTWPRELFTASTMLPKNYRSPEALAEFANLYRPTPPLFEPRATIDALQIVRAPSATNVAAKVAREIEKAIAGGLARSDIAVLSLAGVKLTDLASAGRIGDTPVVRADDPGAHDSVVCDTFLRFKGLERPLVIVAELGERRRHYDTRMHIALTRATLRCVVVATPAELEADPRLKAREGS